MKVELRLNTCNYSKNIFSVGDQSSLEVSVGEKSENLVRYLQKSSLVKLLHNVSVEPPLLSSSSPI